MKGRFSIIENNFLKVVLHFFSFYFNISMSYRLSNLKKNKFIHSLSKCHFNLIESNSQYAVL